MKRSMNWWWLASGLALLVWSGVSRRLFPEFHVDGTDGAALVCLLFSVLHDRAPAAGLPRLALAVGVGITLVTGLLVLALGA